MLVPGVGPTRRISKRESRWWCRATADVDAASSRVVERDVGFVRMHARADEAPRRCCTPRYAGWWETTGPFRREGRLVMVERRDAGAVGRPAGAA